MVLLRMITDAIVVLAAFGLAWWLRYGAEIGQEIMVLGGSSPGATQFGLVRVRYAPGA